ncbi:hypothetical protein E4T43_07006 [Aureobasidium subglaciale]|nr:hypothetical protein E4T43_07006 [Aureobasidium subglaciale]
MNTSSVAFTSLYFTLPHRTKPQQSTLSINNSVNSLRSSHLNSSVEQNQIHFLSQTATSPITTRSITTSKRSESGTPTDEADKRPRLDINEQIQRAGVLAAQLREAATAGGDDSKVSTASQIAGDELMRLFESMQEKTAGSVEGLIQAQIKAESAPLQVEIRSHLSPDGATIRRRVADIAYQKMEHVNSPDLAARVTEAVESAILEEFQKGINKQMREIMA